MLIKRHCKVCGKEFEAIKSTQYFCCRKCFKKHYYRKNKRSIEKIEHNPKFPLKECSFCGLKSQLDFDPIKNSRLYESWTCPECGVSSKMIWKYQNTPQSRTVIQQIVATVNQKVINLTPKYKVYRIPIAHPEECDTKILTMSCEVIDIMDIQKTNKKKIIFS